MLRLEERREAAPANEKVSRRGKWHSRNPRTGRPCRRIIAATRSSRRWRWAASITSSSPRARRLAFYQESIAKARHHNRPVPRLVTVTHEHVSLNAALGLCRGQRQAVAATAAHVDCRHAALRRRHPYRLAQRPAGDDHRGRRALGLYRQHAGLARGRRPSLGAAGVRPGRHRSAIHQMGQAARIPGQSRPAW